MHLCKCMQCLPEKSGSDICCFSKNVIIFISEMPPLITAFSQFFVLFYSDFIVFLVQSYHDCLTVSHRLYLNRNHLTNLNKCSHHYANISILHLSLWFLSLFFSNHARPVQEDYAVSSNPRSLLSAPWRCHATAVAKEPRRGQTTRTWAKRKMMKGLQEEVALLNQQERKFGRTTTGTERGRREKVQREEEVGVLREAERVGRQRKVSVCLVGSSNIGLCFFFLHSHQSNTVSHDAPWLPNISTAATLVSKQGKEN